MPEPVLTLIDGVHYLLTPGDPPENGLPVFVVRVDDPAAIDAVLAIRYNAVYPPRTKMAAATAAAFLRYLGLPSGPFADMVADPDTPRPDYDFDIDADEEPAKEPTDLEPVNTPPQTEDNANGDAREETTATVDPPPATQSPSVDAGSVQEPESVPGRTGPDGGDVRRTHRGRKSGGDDSPAPNPGGPTKASRKRVR